MQTVRHAHHLHLLQAQDAEQADHEGGGGDRHLAARCHGAESHVTLSRCCHAAVTVSRAGRAALHTLPTVLQFLARTAARRA